MLFTSTKFILFITITICAYYIFPKRHQWKILLLSSYIFYFFAGTFYPLFIFFTSLSTYFIAVRIERIREQNDEYIENHRSELSRDQRREYNHRMKNRRKKWMILCLLLNFFVLAVLKYTNFVIDNVDSVLGLLNISYKLDYFDILLPLGISFYTFQSMSYIIDVYWEKVEAQKNFFKYALFVSFFPQLIQGPISRYGDLSKTLYEKHSFNYETFKYGLIRMLWGYFKKLVIADRILVAVNTLIEAPDYYCGAYVLLVMIFYGIELYADFTGGIDITIGIAQMFGITVAENFQRPYFSKNIAEYWRRWHISMGTWFKDYVFYPLSLSGFLKNITAHSKKHFGKGFSKRLPVYISTIITWFTTGIWHGASWNFVVWGLMNGIVILISEELSPLYQKFHDRFPSLAEKRSYAALQIIRTFLLMSSLRLFDCYRDVKTAFHMFFSIFYQFNPFLVTKEELLDLGLGFSDYIIVAIGVIIMFIVSMHGRQGSVREKLNSKHYVVRYAVYSCLVLAILLYGAYGIGYDATQFIYNQF